MRLARPRKFAVLLATAGTLQGTLSAYFGSPVTIEVVSQAVDDGTIRRTVDLVCKERELVTCRAHTDIHVEDGQIRQLIVVANFSLIRKAIAPGAFPPPCGEGRRTNGTQWSS